MKKQEIEIILELTEGHQKRFTEACCRVLAKRDRQSVPPALAVKTVEKEHKTEARGELENAV